MKEINWTKWSSISEIISSVAIIITLVYLSIQTEQNTDATSASATQSILASGQEFLQLVVDDPELNLLQYKPALDDETFQT